MGAFLSIKSTAMLHFNIPEEAPINKKYLINEQTSPLHRIMWVYNAEDPQKRSFENNICAFHIGNGYFLSVAHNLRIQAGVIKSINEELFKKELLFKMDGAQKLFWDDHYFLDEYSRKFHINNLDQQSLQNIANILKIKRFDTRWVTLAEKNICVPHLVVQFKNSLFYNNEGLTELFAPHQIVHEPEVGKHTFLLEVQLVEAFYGSDIALYKVVNTPDELIQQIPAIEPNFDFLEDTPTQFSCLQSSPNSPAGRMLNEARIEGMLDHFGIFNDDFGGNYIFEGYRYLVKSYFRFGSSGAPYIYFDNASGSFKVNAIQSEASGIQLSIKNDKEGNFQYINAIASPLHIIKDEILKHLQA